MISLCGEMYLADRNEYLKCDFGKICCVTSCGSCFDGISDTTDRSNGWFDNMLVYMDCGTAQAQIDGRKYDVSPGDILFIKKDVPYIVKYSDGAKYFFAHFTTEIPLSEFGLSGKNVFFVGADEELKSMFTRVMLTLKFGKSHFKQTSLYMAELLLYVGTCGGEKTQSGATIENIAEFMYDSCRGKSQISDFAKIAGMSERSFSAQFKRKTGISPKQYLQLCKVQIMKEHISAYPTIPLKELALTCGFSDYKYLVKLFKKETGMTPYGYRKSLGPDTRVVRYISQYEISENEKG